jgi:hypothetical protein
MALRRAATQMATAGSIGISGDLAMQIYENKHTIKLDGARTARLSTFRMMQAPIADATWQVFDRVIKFPGAYGVAAKVAADQIIIMPPFTAGFWMWMGLTDGNSLGECVNQTKREFLPFAMTAAPFWSAVHVVTFSVVPGHLRIAWVSVASIAWNAFASYSAERSKHQGPTRTPVVETPPSPRSTPPERALAS